MKWWMLDDKYDSDTGLGRAVEGHPRTGCDGPYIDESDTIFLNREMMREVAARRVRMLPECVYLLPWKALSLSVTREGEGIDFSLEEKRRKKEEW